MGKKPLIDSTEDEDKEGGGQRKGAPTEKGDITTIAGV